jgi:hypothetical protein
MAQIDKNYKSDNLSQEVMDVKKNTFVAQYESSGDTPGKFVVVITTEEDSFKVVEKLLEREGDVKETDMHRVQRGGEKNLDCSFVNYEKTNDIYAYNICVNRAFQIELP